MTGARYTCCDDDRRATLAASGPAGMSGIDYVEVTQGNPVTIDIHLVRPLPKAGASLSAANVVLTGGVRLPPPKVDDVQEEPAGPDIAFYRVVLASGSQTDFSTYRLALVAGPGLSAPPAFIEPRLSAVEFSFKVDCPSDFDCLPEPPLPDPAPVEAEFDLLARDWEGFRRLMLDRMAVLVPGFRQDDPVDLTTTLIETLAWRADQQSYRIDWVGTEAFLDTARHPTSLARHARLMDYRPAQGSSARGFVAFTFAPDGGALADGLTLPRGTPLLPGEASVLLAAAYPGALAGKPVVFETLEELRLWAWQGEIAFHTWGDGRCTLPQGATSATVVDASGGAGALKAGDFLLLEEVAAPSTGEAADADPARRHVLRLTAVTPVTDVLSPGVALADLSWGAADALPFDLVISAEVARLSGPPQRVTCAVARGNVTLADHGASLPPPAHLGLPPSTVAALRPRLDPATPLAGEDWRPVLRGGIAELARGAALGPSDPTRPGAAALLAVRPADCAASLALLDSFARWTARPDLLSSGAFSRDFVVEAAPDGAPSLRFGDGIHGLQPAAGTGFTVSGRFGSGPSGMIGPDALRRIVLPDGLAAARLSVRNPLPTTGGTAPESLDAIRLAAPQAFRVQDRAVTAADYAEAAMRHPEVANAAAQPRWTGAFQTMVIHVDRLGGLPVDAAFRTALLTHLEHFRLAGFDVAVRGAVAAPLDIALEVCAMPQAIRATVGQRVRRALSPFGPADGSRGFFHPDNFTFGTVLYLSRLVAAVMAVDGVQSVRPVTFQRFRRLADGELAAGLIRPNGAEVLELRDDPNFPEGGRLDIWMGGGR